MRLFSYWTEHGQGWIRLGRKGPGLTWRGWSMSYLPWDALVPFRENRAWRRKERAELRLVDKGETTVNVYERLKQLQGKAHR